VDIGAFKEWFTLENIMNLIKQYRSFGPIPGILLPMLEAFIPILPLIVFVMANANAFGLWLGFLYSWLGACLGAFIVFLIVRKFGQRKIFSFLSKHPKVQKLMKWVERHGFGPIFLLVCFPFTPSALVNIVAGLSKISLVQYTLAIFIGKMVMIFTISFVGYDLHSLMTKPLRSILVTVIIFVLWYVGKRIEVRLNKSLEKVHNEEIDRSRG
jgi:uncharacterized membrane protein YdjX (TVP38/TMEM64 family)